MSEAGVFLRIGINLSISYKHCNNNNLLLARCYIIHKKVLSVFLTTTTTMKDIYRIIYYITGVQIIMYFF